MNSLQDNVHSSLRWTTLIGHRLKIISWWLVEKIFEKIFVVCRNMVCYETIQNQILVSCQHLLHWWGRREEDWEEQAVFLQKNIFLQIQEDLLRHSDTNLDPRHHAAEISSQLRIRQLHCPRHWLHQRRPGVRVPRHQHVHQTRSQEVVLHPPEVTCWGCQHHWHALCCAWQSACWSQRHSWEDWPGDSSEI